VVRGTKDFGRQGFASVAVQGCAQGLAAHLGAQFTQLDLQPARAVTAFVMVKNRHHFRFPGRFAGPRRPRRLCVPPTVVVAGHDTQHLAELPDDVVNPLLVNELQRAHRVGGCAKMAMAFFKMSSSCAYRLLTVRRARTSVVSPKSVGKGGWAAYCQA